MNSHVESLADEPELVELLARSETGDHIKGQFPVDQLQDVNEDLRGQRVETRGGRHDGQAVETEQGG